MTSWQWSVMMALVRYVLRKEKIIQTTLMSDDCDMAILKAAIDKDKKKY